MNLFNHIKQRISILDVVSEYATLKKAGLYYKGCCPFHHERTASFSVSPHREMFYCFGCHAGGDVISFIAKVEHCSPIEAARHLVDRYHIEVPQEVAWEKAQDTEESKKLYYSTCTVFARWCSSMLEKNKSARTYVLNRFITEESIEQWMIGYCPTDSKSLLSFAQKEGILAQNFIDASLLFEGRTGLYSPFEERIIFPIRDHLGRFVGFGGRIFKEGDQRAKYYNSHDHDYFNKGTILYGLDRAKKEIAQKESAFLVEGYTDLIIMNQFGFANTVATLGTACTLEHLKQLARFAQRIYVTYDGDAAGQNAILRLVELCWQVAIDPYVLPLPSADDPASFLLSGGNLQEKVDTAADIFSFVVHHLGDDFLKKSLQERLAIAQRVIALIQHIPDPLKRDLLLKQASDTFALPIETLKRGAVKTRSNHPPSDKADQGNTENQQPLEISQLEKKVFSAILNTRSLITAEDEDLIGALLGAHLTKIFEIIKTPGAQVHTFLEFLTEEEKALIAQVLIAHEPTEVKNTDEDVKNFMGHFYKKQWKKKVLDVKLRVVEAQKEGNPDQVRHLLNDLDALKKKMLKRGIA